MITYRYVHQNKFLQIYYICVLKPEERKRLRRNLQICTQVCVQTLLHVSVCINLGGFETDCSPDNWR